MTDKTYKIVFYSPTKNAQELRDAIGKAGAGKIGTYSNCTFSIKGITRFKPEEGSDPEVGEIGELVEVEEERIETVCEQNKLKDVIKAIKDNHPYEEPSMDVYPIEKI